MPDRVGDTQMATLISKPDVVEFIDFISGEEGQSIHMESISFENLPHSIKSKTLKEIMVWKKTGVNLLVLKTPKEISDQSS
jgi:voltage-gated potassium channel